MKKIITIIVMVIVVIGGGYLFFSNQKTAEERLPEYEMIEFFDPDFDVLAYVVSDLFYNLHRQACQKDCLLKESESVGQLQPR